MYPIVFILLNHIMEIEDCKSAIFDIKYCQFHTLVSKVQCHILDNEYVFTSLFYKISYLKCNNAGNQI